MGSNEVHLWAWPVLVLPAVICAGGTVWWVQPHLAADRNSWTAVRRWIQKNMKKSKAPGDRRFCYFAYLDGFIGFAGCAGYADYADFIGFGTEAFFLNTLVPAEQF